MPSFNQFSAWIECDGVRLSEYAVENTHTNANANANTDNTGTGGGTGKEVTVSCWVPSEAEKCFQVISHDSHRAYSTAHKIAVDGQEVRYHFRLLALPSSSTTTSSTLSVTKSAKRNGNGNGVASLPEDAEVIDVDAFEVEDSPLSGSRTSVVQGLLCTPSKSSSARQCMDSSPLSSLSGTGFGSSPFGMAESSGESSVLGIPSAPPEHSLGSSSTQSQSQSQTVINRSSHHAQSHSELTPTLASPPSTPPRRVQSRDSTSQELALPKSSFARFTGFSQSSTYKQPFMFSKCNVAEGQRNSNKTPSPNSSKIGTIIVHISRIELSDEKKQQSRKIEPVKLAPLNVSEGVVHGVQLGPRTYAPSSLAKYAAITTRKERVVTFMFRYRPIEVLEASGLTVSTAPLIRGSVENSEGDERRSMQVVRAEPPMEETTPMRQWVDLTVDDEDKNPFVVQTQPNDLVNSVGVTSDSGSTGGNSSAEGSRDDPVNLALGSDEEEAKHKPKEENEDDDSIASINPIDLTLDSDHDSNDERVRKTKAEEAARSMCVSPIDLTADDDLPASSTKDVGPSMRGTSLSRRVPVKKEEKRSHSLARVHVIDLTVEDEPELEEVKPKVKEEERVDEDNAEYETDPEWADHINNLRAQVDALRKQCRVPMRKKRKRERDDGDGGRGVKKEVKVEDGCFSAT